MKDATVISTTCPDCGAQLQRRKGNLRSSDAARRWLLWRHGASCQRRPQESTNGR